MPVSDIRKKAFELYKGQKGKIKLSEIARTLDTGYSNVAYWKKADNWEKFLQNQNDDSLLDAVENNGLLDEHEKMFCLSYIKNFNYFQSAVNAGYAKNEAKQKGHALLAKPEIRNMIMELKQIRRKSLLIDEFDILERHMQIAFADINDYIVFGTEENDTDGSNQNILYFKDSAQVDGCLVCEVSKTRDGPHIKLADRQKSLDWLSNYFFLNPLDRHKQDFDLKKLALEQEKLHLSRSDSQATPVEIEIKRKED